MKKITILIADDHAVVRTGLAALLATEPDFSIIGQARNGADAVREAKRLKPETKVTAKDIDGCIVVVNDKQTGKHASLKDGDTVMLMSPVCGG